MGCDIHFHVEYLGRAAWDDPAKPPRWLPLEWPERECWSCKGTGVNGANYVPEWRGKPCSNCNIRPGAYASNYKHQRYLGKPGRIREQWYTGRNYNVFALLANVRNYYGVEPIAEPRNLPHDVSYQIKEAADEYGNDGHSHTWIHFGELRAFVDREKASPRYATASGVVNADEYLTFRSKGRPELFSGDVYGQNVVKVSNGQMDAFLLGREPALEGRSVYTTAHWQISYLEMLQPFLEQVLPAQAIHGTAEMRCVFWFDN